ncbi:uncharacterized protein LOC108118485 [Drosophila eugracilis]|uniref:uncharacterized protein LOC108118485 n=1 Tax=Drosophila eugracilis TaxID=29029 RepID=UPI0007E812B3|nr:uncharacterized protein LOC108118485 [Drosophila eugracilis]
MKIYEEVIFTDQLLHQRTVGSQIEETRRTWEKLCSWYPEAQRQHYEQYAEIYRDSLKKYGNNHFEYYANRNRLREKHRYYTRSFEERRSKIKYFSMDHLIFYKAPRTSNAEYGSVKPMRLFKIY